MNFEYDIESRNMEVYASPPAHIDREVWEPCAKCVGCGNCYYFLYDDDEYPCDKCLKGSTAKNPYPEFKPIGFCKHCGRPLTEKAWVELEKRLDFGHMLNWVSVEERLPRDGQSVLVWCSSRMLTKHVSFSTFYEGKWSRGVKEVTHWMPLPEPPAELEKRMGVR